MLWEGDVAAGDSGFPVAQRNNVQKQDTTLLSEALDPGLEKDEHQGGLGRTWTRTC